MLGLAFTIEIPAFQDEWRHNKFNLYADEENSYLAFEETILGQIVDLKEMDEAGSLSNEQRYFGLDSPRGNRWYNFDSITYLECAVAGIGDNWEEAEDSQNSVLDRDTSLNQNNLISWKQIKEFFWCGQIYE